MTFGLTIEKLLLIGLIAVMIIGPERLPAAAESLRRTIQQARRMARSAQERVREELGPEVADVDWQRLDPRQYDPRRIIREALLAEPDAPTAPAVPLPPDSAEAPAVTLPPDPALTPAVTVTAKEESLSGAGEAPDAETASPDPAVTPASTATPGEGSLSGAGEAPDAQPASSGTGPMASENRPPRAPGTRDGSSP